MERNCAVREKTADGVSVGRCWFFTSIDENGVLNCHRHGDVTEIQKQFTLTGELGKDPRVRCKRCQGLAEVRVTGDKKGYCLRCSQIGE